MIWAKDSWQTNKTYMKTSHLTKCAMVLLAVALAAGCAQHHGKATEEHVTPVGTEVVVPVAPPLPEVETMTITPGQGYVWIPGAWDWRGNNWVWDQGHWAYPPRAGAVWASPRYENRGDKRVFIEGGWKY